MDPRISGASETQTDRPLAVTCGPWTSKDELVTSSRGWTPHSAFLWVLFRSQPPPCCKASLTVSFACASNRVRPRIYIPSHLDGSVTGLLAGAAQACQEHAALCACLGPHVGGGCCWEHMVLRSMRPPIETHLVFGEWHSTQALLLLCD